MSQCAMSGANRAFQGRAFAACATGATACAASARWAVAVAAPNSSAGASGALARRGLSPSILCMSMTASRRGQFHHFAVKIPALGAADDEDVRFLRRDRMRTLALVDRTTFEGAAPWTAMASAAPAGCSQRAPREPSSCARG
jgi:hypothetical protein